MKLNNCLQKNNLPKLNSILVQNGHVAFKHKNILRFSRDDFRYILDCLYKTPQMLDSPEWSYTEHSKTEIKKMLEKSKGIIPEKVLRNLIIDNLGTKLYRHLSKLDLLVYLILLVNIPVYGIIALIIHSYRWSRVWSSMDKTVKQKFIQQNSLNPRLLNNRWKDFTKDEKRLFKRWHGPVAAKKENSSTKSIMTMDELQKLAGASEYEIAKELGDKKREISKLVSF